MSLPPTSNGKTVCRYDGEIKAKEHRLTPPVVGEEIIIKIDNLFIRLSQWVDRVIPQEMNPLLRTGAIANVNIFIAIITGFIVLIWYRPSVHEAYASMKAMEAMPFTAGLVRSVHRYSSDAAVLFVFIHAAEIFLTRRFGSGRWLAWLTGVFLLVTLWFEGWIGYWLVWDDRAKDVAIGTSKMTDVLPIFAEPMSKSFLTDGGVNSLFFFVIFFLHMLVPMAMAVGLWLHITRLAKSRFLTSAKLTGVITLSLILYSLIWPAQVSQPANMLKATSGSSIDAFYLLPLYLTDHLGGGALWAIFLGLITVISCIPFIKRKTKTPASYINSENCNGCRSCFDDCPFNAIEMVPAIWTETEIANIDPVKCIRCGICSGSCSSSAVVFPAKSVESVEAQIKDWFGSEEEKQKASLLVFVCGNSAGGEVSFDPISGLSKDLPDCRVIAVPCISWVNRKLVNTSIALGAKGILMGGCGEEYPIHRFGVDWIKQRHSRDRQPYFSKSKMNGFPFQFVFLNRTEKKEFFDRAKKFLDTTESIGLHKEKSKYRKALVSAGLIAAFAAMVHLPNQTPYSSVGTQKAEFVVSFKHIGEYKEQPRAQTEKQKHKLSHMQAKTVFRRERLPVRMRVFVDGSLMADEQYPAQGFYNDGYSVGTARYNLKPGFHDISILIGDSADQNEFRFKAEKRSEFKLGTVQVVLFDKEHGFKWH